MYNGHFSTGTHSILVGVPLEVAIFDNTLHKGRLGNIRQTNWDNLMVAFPGTCGCAFPSACLARSTSGFHYVAGKRALLHHGADLKYWYS